ncbi:hypothetical protein ABN034_12300 [Actinopolymorpha sp. B11F2]|uniref:hypothetical protein n=1 Tax=Actinopolymorpha sp. B11F2 TaxID=3160862 RepID=UPI0032E451B4
MVLLAACVAPFGAAAESRVDDRWPRRERFGVGELGVQAGDVVGIDPAGDDRLVRAQSDPYPNAFTFHRGKRLRVVEASVSEGRYGGTPGRIFIREGDGVVIVAGADARRGHHHGLVLRRVRTDDGDELPATDYFRTMGGYLPSHPGKTGR